MTLVTLSASYGAGGSWIGPRLAERLGVDFLDRAIPRAVAERLSVSLDEALAHDESLGSVWERFVSSFVLIQAVGPVIDVPRSAVLGERAYRDETERVILEHARDGSGVVLGRGAAVILREHPRALHVRLHGPPERRVAQAVMLGGVDRETAERHCAENDRAREGYVKHFYGVDPSSCSLYHLVIDSTSIPLDACLELIVRAVQGRTEQ